VTKKGDLLDEADESVLVNLSNPVNADLGVPQATGTILDDDPPEPAVTVSIAAGAPLVEGGAGSQSAPFTLTLSGVAAQTLTVDYATASGTASSPSDFAAKSGTVSFSPGQTSKTVSIWVKGDLNEELDESFTVTLTNPQGLTIAEGGGVAALTILNDDGQPALGVADKSVTEVDSGTRNLVFTVTLSASTYNTVTVAYQTLDAGSGLGELSASANAPIADSQATGTILDDE
jgi:hypothetical protein